MLRDHQHREHDQRVQLQVRAVDCLQPQSAMLESRHTDEVLGLGLNPSCRMKKVLPVSEALLHSHLHLLQEIRNTVIKTFISLPTPLGYLIITR